MKFNIYNNVSYDETLNDKLAWGGDYMEEREEVRDLRGRSELPPSLFSEGFFFPWNDWPEKDRLFLDEPPWLAISNDLTLLFQFLNLYQTTIVIKLEADFWLFPETRKKTNKNTYERFKFLQLAKIQNWTIFGSFRLWFLKPKKVWTE